MKMTYSLRELQEKHVVMELESIDRLYLIIERLPKSHRYRLTPSGLKTALFYTRLSQRLLRPGLSLLHDPKTAPSSPMAAAYRRFAQSVDDFAVSAIQKLAA